MQIIGNRLLVEKIIPPGAGVIIVPDPSKENDEKVGPVECVVLLVGDGEKINPRIEQGSKILWNSRLQQFVAVTYKNQPAKLILIEDVLAVLD